MFSLRLLRDEESCCCCCSMRSIVNDQLVKGPTDRAASVIQKSHEKNVECFSRSLLCLWALYRLLSCSSLPHKHRHDQQQEITKQPVQGSRPRPRCISLTSSSQSQASAARNLLAYEAAVRPTCSRGGVGAGQDQGAPQGHSKRPVSPGYQLQAPRPSAKDTRLALVAAPLWHETSTPRGARRPHNAHASCAHLKQQTRVVDLLIY